ncbi:MAG TPA: ribonuclease J [Candidatus Altiarchaeales archaeon]|nr:ribonuclease J [Candidatus Altiarchaeales archaeon]
MKITAVAGYKAVGRNMTGVTLGKETVAIDNGIRLDTLQMYDKSTDSLKKLDIDELIRMDIIPKVDRLKNIVAQIVSHGHLDHIGALPINRPRVPIIGNHYTIELCRREFRDGNYYSVDYREEFEISKNFSVEFIEVTHSIPYTSIVVLHTPEGDVVYVSDFRIDNYSRIAKTDYKRLREIGRENVKAMIVESTRCRENGKTPSEEVVRHKLKEILEFIDSGLIITTTFSTHIERIQSILDEVEAIGRTPIILGRSLLKNIDIAERFNLIDLPLDSRLYSTSKAISNVLRDIKNRDDYFLLVTGHQGELDSVLSKILDNRYSFRIEKGDSIIFCADPIPTPVNFASRYVLETKLKSLGARIFDRVHVSGHAAKEDHRKMLRMIRPDHVIPCHGGIDMRGQYAILAVEEGYTLNENVHLLMNGDNIEL